MKLAAIYNVWADSRELLKKSIDNISPVVDVIVVVSSKFSNFGAEFDWNIEEYLNHKCHLVEIHPKRKLRQAYIMETEKRNVGINVARNLGCTHFIIMDADEFYFQSEVEEAKRKVENLEATVVRSQLYFKEPTLTIGFDVTLVPFICRMSRQVELIPDYRQFPFTYMGGFPRIDPTRRPNITAGVEFWETPVMHHYSWVRSDYDLKINNSSARTNLQRSKIKEDLRNAAPGYYCEFYKAELQSCPNYFNI